MKTDDIVEVVLIDEGRNFNLSSHLMHIHGNHLAVIGMGTVSSNKTPNTDVELT